MSKKRLPNIAVCARMRSGKDAFYEIAEELGYHVKRVAYGDTMKRMFHECFPAIPYEPKPIGHYQTFGQSLRAIDPDVFVRPTIGDVLVHKAHLAQYGIDVPAFIFTDVRQPNEFVACTERLNCITIRINASVETRTDRMRAKGEAVRFEILHAETERHLDNFPVNYTIDNNGTYTEYRQQVKNLLEKLEVVN
ncbi:nucleoside kinase [Bacillus phage Anath]|uniref:Nucleoside kinase n=1 Tax=Bacillus phage Anath TaxID=2108114 RepID=A0A2P1JUN9_9CAUD|nr:nucleoside kinase [Bacillus phage Anath]